MRSTGHPPVARRAGPAHCILMHTNRHTDGAAPQCSQPCSCGSARPGASKNRGPRRECLSVRARRCSRCRPKKTSWAPQPCSCTAPCPQSRNTKRGTEGSRRMAGRPDSCCCRDAPRQPSAEAHRRAARRTQQLPPCPGGSGCRCTACLAS
eukprot:1796923-Prymnesium_polylepis.1